MCCIRTMGLVLGAAFSVFWTEGAFYKGGAVATVHPLATQAAIEAATRGGNAVDAAVAAGLTLGVVDGHNSGIGGGCFMFIRTERGTFVLIDGRETAPAKASREMFLRDGKADPSLSQTGSLAIGVPGSLAAYEYALRHFGRLRLRDHLLAAAELAERGFEIDESYARRIALVRDEMKGFAATSEIFLTEGEVPGAGTILRQPDLARTYRAIAEKGVKWFYETEFPERVEGWMRENGGVVTGQDFREYRIELRTPVRTRYRDYEVLGFPPPSSGGVHVAQILGILEQFNLKEHQAYSVDSIHLIAESMKLAFADRAYWLGDPAFAKVPRGLVARNYAALLAGGIRLDKAMEVRSHGAADQFSTGNFGRHTTHFSTADAAGNWVACTATVNTSFGSKVVIPGTGVIMNNQMDDFSAQPGVPNFFGLMGAEANAVAPKKRPLSSMSPTIVLHQGQPVLSLGAAGGPTIISQTVVNLINMIDYGMGPEEALRAARIHHQWKPDELKLERAAEGARDDLARRGHKVTLVDSLGAAQIVARTTNGFIGVADPRVTGGAGGGW